MPSLPQGQVGATSASGSTAEGFKLLALIRAYMTHGHFKADLDPLNLDKIYATEVSSKFKKPGHEMLKLLEIEHYGFTETDLDRKFSVHLPQWGGLLAQKGDWTLREIVDAMSKAYCGKIGVEYMHMPSRD